MEENNGCLNLSYLKYWKTTALPEGLSVGRDLELRDTSITTLPEGLSVGGSLDLRGTKSPPCRKVCP